MAEILSKLVKEEYKKKKEDKYWYYKELKHLSNEEIVKLIQETNNEKYWYELDMRTRKLYSSVLRDKVHPYYKENMKEDIISILKTGWLKAVKTYDESRATAEFIPYCSFLMEQNYKMFIRRITPEKIGSSVRDENISYISTYDNDNDEKMIAGCADIIMKDECKEYNNIEVTDYIKDMLNRLKEHDEIQYTIIKKHFIDKVTQKDLGIMLNMSQSAISRNIKKGISFLKDEIKKENML